MSPIHTDIFSLVSPIKHYLLGLQRRVCDMLEQIDGKSVFKEDAWQHKEQGGGLTKVMADGLVIEKAAVNFSHVLGQALPPAATLKRPECINAPFQALGVSVVIHPRNPYVPTTHANVRFIVVENNKGDPHWWFGGGFDLTPYYGFKEDCLHWHQTAKSACDPFDLTLYPKFKKWCDDYFYLTHRKEPRGIGGLFFDDFNERDMNHSFSFMQSIGDHFIKAYQPIIMKRKDHPFFERERDFQCYRRGRYVEFNLLYDRGTLFGLQSGGRTESILVSLPPTVRWEYDWTPAPGSHEDELYREFLILKDWLA